MAIIILPTINMYHSYRNFPNFPQNNYLKLTHDVRNCQTLFAVSAICCKFHFQLKLIKSKNISRNNTQDLMVIDTVTPLRTPLGDH